MYDDFLSTEKRFLMMVEPVFVIQFNVLLHGREMRGRENDLPVYSVGQSREGGKVRLSPSRAGVSWGSVS